MGKSKEKASQIPTKSPKDGLGMYADGTTCRLTIGVTAKKKKKSGHGWSLNKKGGTKLSF